MKRLLIVAGCLALASCATAPSQIQPSYVSQASYQGMTCDQLEARRAEVQASLDPVLRSQERARTTDTVGVAVIGVPVASLFGGNRRDTIADYRGQLVAIRLTSEEKHCAPAPTPPAG